jgi:hypothetical protein
MLVTSLARCYTLSVGKAAAATGGPWNSEESPSGMGILTC